MMVRDYNQALQFVNDYFQMDYKKFLSLYFSGERAAEIERNTLPRNTGNYLIHCQIGSLKSSVMMLQNTLLSLPDRAAVKREYLCISWRHFFCLKM